MKKILNISFVYFILAMVGGVFYREFTKILGFNGKTTLAYVHVHLLVLGTFLFLIIALFCRDSELLDNRRIQQFLIVYNVSLPLMVCMLLIRGILQATEFEVTNAMNGMIAGIAGISHIFLAISLWMLFSSLKQVFVNENN